MRPLRVPALRVVLVLLVALLPTLAFAQAGKLNIYFFDVGQGDSSLIVTPSGKTILVDGGPPDSADHLAERVRALVHGKLDLVVLTHPHLDHLGGMLEALQAVGCKRFMDSGFDHPSKAYKDLLEWVGANVGQVMTPIPDPARPQDLVKVGLGDGITMTILWPRAPVEPYLENTRSDPNSNSIVFKLTYGETAFLFVGDAEPDTEDYLLQKNIDLHATLLKVGHHGGRHSTTEPWLKRIEPKLAVIQVSAHNDYGHPGQETLARLEAANAEIYRNDEDGEIHVESDGTTVGITSERKKRGSDGWYRVRGGVKGPVQTGPILPSVRHLSDATLEDQKRYGHKHEDMGPAMPEIKRTAVAADLGNAGAVHFANEPAPELPPPPKKPDELIPAEVKEKYAAKVEKVKYVASKRSGVFHMSDCAAVQKIKAENRIEFDSRADAAKDRKPAEDCNP